MKNWTETSSGFAAVNRARSSFYEEIMMRLRRVIDIVSVMTLPLKKLRLLIQFTLVRVHVFGGNHDGEQMEE